jgi:hypothetical protein
MSSTAIVEKDEFRVDGEASGDLGPAALTARQGDPHAFTDVLQPEFVEKLLQPLLLLILRERCELQDRLDVVLHRKSPENGRFLRQVADPQLSPPVHRHPRNVGAVEEHLTGKRLDQPDDDIEGGGLAGTVGSQQAHDLALLHLQGDFIDHRALPVPFDDRFSS